MKQQQYTTTSTQETQMVAANFAVVVLGAKEQRIKNKLSKQSTIEETGASVITLAGDLGAGKTTFAQGFLGALGAEGPYTSPTFTIMKTYPLADGRTVYHIDPYRISADDLVALGWEEMLRDPHAIILLEWPQIVAALVPPDAVQVTFTHVDEQTRRVVVAGELPSGDVE